MAEPNTLANYDYSVPDYNAGAFKTPTATNPYAVGTPQAGVYNNYQRYLGRAPENDQVVNQWAQNPNYAQGIMNSQEGLTDGRARNEINPLIDAEIEGYGREAGIERLRAGQQLESLRPYYEQQLGGLQFGLGEQMSGLDSAQREVEQGYGMQSSRLQSQYEPARLNAMNTANRRGLLDSSIGLELINQGYKPISQGLSDLALQTQNKLATFAQNRQNLQKKYNFDIQSLTGEREMKARQLRDELALQQAQLATQASRLEAQRGAKVAARTGELGDYWRNYEMQRQQQQSALEQFNRTFGEQQRQFNENLALQKQAANKL